MRFVTDCRFSTGPLVQYKELVEKGQLQHDPHQERVAVELENLLGRLEDYDKNMEEYCVCLFLTYDSIPKMMFS